MPPMKHASAESWIGDKRRDDLLARTDTPRAATDSLSLDISDVLDAIVCVLAGQDFLTNKAQPPAAESLDVARKEGWIWVRGPSQE